MAEKTSVTYDTATISNAEIIAPHIDKTGPMLEARALREGMLVAETRDAILSVTGGKTEFSDNNEVATVLRAAAAVVRANRGKGKAGASSATNDSKFDLNNVTTADINRLNAEYYK